MNELKEHINTVLAAEPIKLIISKPASRMTNLLIKR
jgi:hypothetical protein